MLTKINLISRIFIAVVAALVVSTALASSASGKASHDGWPINKCISQWKDEIPGCGIYQSHNFDQNGVLTGTGRSDELLGGHGNDIAYGRDSGDVIWGDFWPSDQPSSQSDRLYGGNGNDFIYASHGMNDMSGGAGNDVIHAHFGRGGSIDCGSGNDLLFLSHRSKPHYSVRNCERISFATE